MSVDEITSGMSPIPEEARARRVLIVDADARSRSRVQRILYTIVDTVEVREELGEIPLAGEFHLLVVNYEELPQADRTRLCRRYLSIQQQVPLLIVTRATHDDLASVFQGRSFTNLLAKRVNDEVDTGELIVTAQKILRGDIFGLAKYFAWGVVDVSMRLTSSKEKAGVLDWVQTYATRVGTPSRLASMLTTVADELVTNAIYNAPVDENGKRLYSHLSRTEAVELKDEEAVEVRLCSDGTFVGISTVDTFGSLNQQQILDYLAKCFRKSDEQVDQKPGGSGLGFYFALDALSHLVFNIRRGRRTEVIGLVNIAGRYRDTLRMGKSFNIFVENTK